MGHIFREAARHAGVDIVAFGHAGDGHLHVNVLADTTDSSLISRLFGLLNEVTALLADLGGTAIIGSPAQFGKSIADKTKN